MAKFSPQDYKNSSSIPSVLVGSPKMDTSISSILKGSSNGIAPNHTTGELYKRKPQFVMCPPKFLSTRIANNVFMKQEKVDTERAMRQYARIKRMMTALDVQVLEVPPQKDCQDQHYTANLAIALNPFIVLAKMSAEGRTEEEAPGRRFFEGRGYTVIQPPHAFEGEADLKKWKDGVYFGGHGKFSDWKAHEWISKKTGIEIIPIRETSDSLYHLDCSLFVLDKENFMVCRGGMDKESFRRLEKVANIIDVPQDVMSTGATNMVKIPGNKKIVLSGMFFPEEKKYQKSMEWMLTTMDKFNYSVIFCDIDEADKSGADISCTVMHLDF